MLCVRKTCCNEFPYVELGKPTIKSLVFRRQLKFYNNCMADKDFPMQHYIIRKTLDPNCQFIRHYVQLRSKYNAPEEITEESLLEMKNSIIRKAEANHSRYQSYIEMNPSLNRPCLYDRYVPTHKLVLVSRLRMVSHYLQIEMGRLKKVHVPVDQRLCSCWLIESYTPLIIHTFDTNTPSCKISVSMNNLTI